MKRRTRNIVWSLLMILALLTAPLKVTAAEQNGESSDKQQNETTEQKTEETEETAPEMTTDLGLGFAVCSFDGGTDRNCSVREKCVGTAKPGEHHKNHDAAADF